MPRIKNVWSICRKKKLTEPDHLAIITDLAIPLLGIYPEKTNSKRYMHPNVHCNTIYNSQDMEAT